MQNCCFESSEARVLCGTMKEKKQLTCLTDPSGTVYLKNLLPDSQKLADLLENILGPTSAAEILAASVNPQLVGACVFLFFFPPVFVKVAFS